MAADVNGKQSLYVMVIHGGIAFAVVIAATVLAFHGSLDAEAATAIFGAALGLAGGTASALGTLGASINGRNIVSQSTMDQREETLRNALSSHPLQTSAPPTVTDTTLTGGDTADGTPH